MRLEQLKFEEPQSDGSFEMTYTEGGVSRVFRYPGERLWEVIERADAKFCKPLTFEDEQRFKKALATGARKPSAR